MERATKKPTNCLGPSGWVSEAEQVAAFLATRTTSVRDTQNDYLCLGRAPDVLEFIDGDLHSYECKLRNWRQAVTQARDHQLVADFSWIVIPTPRKEWVDGLDIGLIDGHTFEVVIQAGRQEPFQFARKKLISRYWPNAEDKLTSPKVRSTKPQKH